MKKIPKAYIVRSTKGSDYVDIMGRSAIDVKNLMMKRFGHHLKPADKMSWERPYRPKNQYGFYRFWRGS